MPDGSNADLIEAIVERIKPELAGQPPQIQGAVLCDLLAIFIAGHVPEIRDKILGLHLRVMNELVEGYDNVFDAIRRSKQ